MLKTGEYTARSSRVAGKDKRTRVFGRARVTAAVHGMLSLALGFYAGFRSFTEVAEGGTHHCSFST